MGVMPMEGYEDWEPEDELENGEFDFEDLDFEEPFILDEEEFLAEGLSYEDWDPEELMSEDLTAYDDVIPEEPEVVVGFFAEEDRGDQALQVLDDLGLSLDDDVTVLRRSEMAEDENDDEAWRIAIWRALDRLLTGTAAEEAAAARDDWRIEGVQMVVLTKVGNLDPEDIQAMFRHCGATEIEYYTGLDTTGLTAEL